MSDLSSSWREVGIGVAIGYAAKYGLLISEGKTPTWRALLGDVLLAGLVGLLGLITVDHFLLTGYPATFLVSLFALTGNHVVSIVKSAFLRWVERRVALATGDVRNSLQADYSKEAVATWIQQHPGEVPSGMKEQIDKLS